MNDIFLKSSPFKFGVTYAFIVYRVLLNYKDDGGKRIGFVDDSRFLGGIFLSLYRVGALGASIL